jgi:hypothetical protein
VITFNGLRPGQHISFKYIPDGHDVKQISGDLKAKYTTQDDRQYVEISPRYAYHGLRTLRWCDVVLDSVTVEDREVDEW